MRGGRVMGRAVPHYVTVQDVPGQPARVYPCDSKAAAMRGAARISDRGHVGNVVKVYEGTPSDGVERDPVKVWS